MRRQGLRTALVGAALLAPVAGATGAQAHTCATPGKATVGERTTVDIRVGAGNSPVVAVDLVVPPQFRLDRPVPLAGWAAERHGSTVSFRSTDDRILPFGCTVFRLAGVAKADVTLIFPIVVHDQDGMTLRYDSADPRSSNAAQIVHAASGGGGGGLPLVALWAGPLVVAGLAGFTVVRRRRRSA